MLRIPVAAVLAALSIATCGDHAGASAAGADVGVWGQGQGWRLVEYARIGAADGEGPEVFGTVADVALDPLGRVWVADGHAQQIRVFDQRGAHVRTIGGRGGGPGEFGMVAGMAWAPDGNLWVIDIVNARFAVYDTAGSLVATHPRNSLLNTSPWPGRFDDAGRLYDVDGTLSSDGSIVTNIVRSSPGASATDTFALPLAEEEMFELRRGDARNQQITKVNVPFSGLQFWALAPDGDVWIANTAEYRIERHAFDGSVRGVIERRHDPVPVSRRSVTASWSPTESLHARGAGSTCPASPIPIPRSPASCSTTRDTSGCGR